jgi:hypothetical protein
MAVIYIEQAGIQFELKNGERTVSAQGVEGLSGLVYVTGSEIKRYPKNAEKIARRVKNKSYVIDDEFVYYYKGEDIDNFKDCAISPYQVLINGFLKKKGISGTVLFVDGNKDAVIVSLIQEGEFKEFSISNSSLFNETLSGVKKFVAKKSIKIDTVVMNDEFYKVMFKNTPVTVLSPTEILEYAQDFQAPVFKKIEDIKKKIQKEKDKKLNMLLAFSLFIFVINLGAGLYTKNLNDKYDALNNSLAFKDSALKQKLNFEIEKKFLSFTRKNMPESLKRTLLKTGSVKNLKIDNIEANNSNFTIKGKFLGGYRNFVKGYNELKKIMSADAVNYVVSAQGKVYFMLKGRIK